MTARRGRRHGAAEASRAVAGFAGGEEVRATVRRSVTLSVRFSADEMALLRTRAEAEGLKLTAYIRAAALQQASPIDRTRLIAILEAASAEVAQAEDLLRAAG